MDIFKTPYKFHKPRTTPSGRKVTQAEREREKKKPLIVDTEFHAAHAHRLHQ